MIRTISIDALTDRYGPLREKYGNAYSCAIDKGIVSIARAGRKGRERKKCAPEAEVGTFG